MRSRASSIPRSCAASTCARIPAEIAEGLAFAWTKPTILLVWGITVVTNAFAFAYSGLVAPLGIGAFHVSPALVGLLAAAEPIGALAGGALIAAGVVRMDRRLTFAGGAALFMVALIVMALSPSYWLAFAVLVLGGFGTAGFGNMQTTLMLTEAPPDDALAPDGHRHGRHRHRAARRGGGGRNRHRVRPAHRRAGHGGDGTVLHRGAGDMAEAPHPSSIVVISNRLHELQDRGVAFELGREDRDHPVGPLADDVERICTTRSPTRDSAGEGRQSRANLAGFGQAIDHFEPQRQLRRLMHVGEGDGAVGLDLRRRHVEGHRNLEPEAAVGIGDRQPSLRPRRRRHPRSIQATRIRLNASPRPR